MYHPHQMYYGIEVHLVHVLFSPSQFLLAEAFVKTCFEAWLFNGMETGKFLTAG